MRYLTKAQVIRLNEATVKAHGGNFMPPSNFLHEENLDYLVEAVQAEMFGEPLSDYKRQGGRILLQYHWESYFYRW